MKIDGYLPHRQLLQGAPALEGPPALAVASSPGKKNISFGPEGFLGVVCAGNPPRDVLKHFSKKKKKWKPIFFSWARFDIVFV